MPSSSSNRSSNRSSLLLGAFLVRLAVTVAPIQGLQGFQGPQGPQGLQGLRVGSSIVMVGDARRSMAREGTPATFAVSKLEYNSSLLRHTGILSTSVMGDTS